MKNLIIVLYTYCISTQAQSSSLDHLKSHYKISISSKEKIKRSEKIPAQLYVYNKKLQRHLPHINILIKKRGASSKFFSKKQFLIKSADKSKKISFFNMPPHSTWVLYGPYIDRSLIRNSLAYHLGENIAQDKYFAPRWRYVELVLNNNYLGLYLLVEKPTRGKNRVSFKKLKETNSNFSFLAKLSAQNKSFKTTKKTEIKYVYPKEKNMNLNQQQFIKKEISELESKIYSLKVNENIDKLSDTVSLDSFINFIIIQEVFKNIDAYRRSAYFYKKDNKFFMGPLWDFNIAAGNINFRGMQKTTGLVIEKKNFYFRNAFWFKKLWRNYYFRVKLRNKYLSLRATILSDKHLHSLIDLFAKNLEKRGNIDNSLWNSKISIFENFFFKTKENANTFKEHIKVLKSWLTHRLSWLDDKI
jgi:hypothetical protein